MTSEAEMMSERTLGGASLGLISVPRARLSACALTRGSKCARNATSSHAGELRFQRERREILKWKCVFVAVGDARAHTRVSGTSRVV